MSERFQYAKTGICRIRNFAQHIAGNYYQRRYIGKLDSMKWYYELRVSYDGKKVFPVIYCGNEDPNVEYKVQIYFKLENHAKNDKKSFEKIKKHVLTSNTVSDGFSAPVLEILDPKNGWLDDGALSFEYGIQVEAVLRNKIWRFNFNDKLFNAGAEMIQIEKEKEGSGSAGRQDALQILHGVRLRLKHDRLFSVLSTTVGEHNMRNVVYYCDVLLTQKRRRSRYRNDEKKWISLANEYNLRHWMVELLKPMKSVKDCVDEENIERMSNESMKMFIAKFLYGKF